MLFYKKDSPARTSGRGNGRLSRERGLTGIGTLGFPADTSMNLSPDQISEVMGLVRYLFVLPAIRFVELSKRDFSFS